MAKRLTVVFIPENASQVKQIRLSRGFLSFFIGLSLVSVAAISYLLYDYIHLIQAMPSIQALEREATSQRFQIQSFAKKINDLKANIVNLQEFEKKIRIMANLERPADENAVFGIGGSAPEDLEASISLTEKQTGLLREMHEQTEQLQRASVLQNEAFAQLHKYLQGQKSLLASTPTIRPTTGWMSSGFGYRVSPFTGMKEFHQGVDIATRMGMEIIAPADGTVISVTSKGGLGKAIVIDHGYGLVTCYGHLKEHLVKRGQHVDRGENIGLVGNTGRTTAPHLHYEVHLNGVPVNPLTYILN